LQTDDILFYNIQFMYEYYAMKKTRNILYAFNTAASSCHRVSLLQLFRKFVQSPQSPTFIQKFLSTFFCSI